MTEWPKMEGHELEQECREWLLEQVSNESNICVCSDPCCMPDVSRGLAAFIRTRIASADAENRLRNDTPESRSERPTTPNKADSSENLDWCTPFIQSRIASVEAAARLDEAKWWHMQRGHHGFSWCCERIAELERAPAQRPSQSGAEEIR
jgi:hypothetical protein